MRSINDFSQVLPLRVETVLAVNSKLTNLSEQSRLDKRRISKMSLFLDKLERRREDERIEIKYSIHVSFEGKEKKKEIYSS